MEVMYSEVIPSTILITINSCFPSCTILITQDIIGYSTDSIFSCKTSFVITIFLRRNCFAACCQAYAQNDILYLWSNPCGTPDSGEIGSEKIQLILISVVLLTRKLASFLQKSSGRLKLLNNFETNIEYYHMSITFLKLRNYIF